MLPQRTDPKKDALRCNLVNLFTPCTYLEHLGKTAAMGNLPKQLSVCSWLSCLSSGQRVPFLPVSPVPSSTVWMHIRLSQDNDAQRGHGCGMCPVLGNGLQSTYKRWLPGANASTNCKIIWPRAFLLLMSEWHQEKKVPMLNLNELQWQVGKGPPQQ